jgi:UPF0716 protein FxsA
MRLLAPLLLIGLPLAEIAAFIQVGQWLGLGPTLALVLLAALAGILLIRHQSLATLGDVRAALARNQTPAAELFDGACVLVAGLLLILPGFISDVAALLLLIRPLRRRLLRAFGWRGRKETTIAADYHEIVDPSEGPREVPDSRWGRAR